jgi:hypothetical protein
MRQHSPSCCFAGDSNERNTNMEILIFAISAGFRHYKSEEKIVPEAYPLQPFDVQTLKQVYNTRVDSSSRTSDRRESYAIQALS